jgi:hypothetical protein
MDQGWSLFYLIDTFDRVFIYLFFIYLLQFFVLHFNLSTRLQWLREILKGAQVQSTCNTIAAPLEMLPRHRLYRSTAMTNTASLLTRVCCWAVDIPASLRCSSACTNHQQHPQSDVWRLFESYLEQLEKCSGEKTSDKFW